MGLCGMLHLRVSANAAATAIAKKTYGKVDLEVI